MRYLTLLLAIAAISYAQSTTGALFGTVTDPTCAPIATAPLRVTETATGVSQTTTANAQDEFLFPALPAGSYRLEAESVGLKRSVRRALR